MILGIVFFVGFLMFSAVDRYQMTTLPTVPHPEQGRTFAHSEKDKTVYRTEQERDSVVLLQGLSICAGVAAVMVRLLK